MSDSIIGLGVVAIVQNSKGELLLIKRKKEPKAGYLSLPGGHVEFGEKAEDAVVREMKEETNLDVEATDFISFYESIHPEYHKFILIYKTKILGNEFATAGDDASEAIWVDLEKIGSLEKITNVTIHALKKAAMSRDL